MELIRDKTARFVTLSLIISIIFLENCNAAPAKFDQRQEGKFNVHANLENFLIVVATSGSQNGGLLNEIAAQALELKNVASRAATLRENEESLEYKIVEKPSSHEQNKEPYSVEIVRIQKEENHDLTNEKKETETPKTDDRDTQTSKDVDNTSVSGGAGEPKKQEVAELSGPVSKETTVKQETFDHSIKLTAENVENVEDQSSTRTKTTGIGNVQELLHSQEQQKQVRSVKIGEEKIEIIEPSTKSDLVVAQQSAVSDEKKKEVIGDDLSKQSQVSAIPVVAIISEDFVRRSVRDTSSRKYMHY